MQTQMKTLFFMYTYYTHKLMIKIIVHGMYDLDNYEVIYDNRVGYTPKTDIYSMYDV